jgi:hypothetical protein
VNKSISEYVVIALLKSCHRILSCEKSHIFSVQCYSCACNAVCNLHSSYMQFIRILRLSVSVQSAACIL